MPNEGDHTHCLTKADLADIWDTLNKMRDTLAKSEAARELNAPKIDEVITLLTVSKGILTVTKALFFVAAPIGAFIYWVKDHVKL